MKNKSFLACFLVLCMALSCGTAVFADTFDANGTTLEQDLGDVTVAVTGTTNGTGLDVTAENGGTAEITADSVTVQSENGGATGVLAWGTTSDSSVTVTVENGVTATSDNSGAAGAMVRATNGDTSVTVNGDVVSTGNNFASGVGASEGQVMSVTVEGNVTATSGGGVTAVFAGRADDATVTVSGNVTADAGTGQADGVYILNDAVDGLNTTVTIGGDVKAESDTGNASGIYNNSGKTSTVDATVEGSVTAETTDGAAFGIFSHSNDSAETHITVDGDITAASDTHDATGILVQSSADKGTDTDISVGGDVTVTAGQWAVGASITESTNTDISIDGDVTATGGEIAIGVGAYRSENGSITVNGDVTANSGIHEAEGVVVFGNILNNLDTTVTVNGDVHAESEEGRAYGLDVNMSEDSEVVVTVNGDVSATAEKRSTGIEAIADNDASVTISVSGDVVSEAEGANGLVVYSRNDGSADITVGGDVVVNNSIDFPDPAYGILAGAYDGGTTSITVGGDVSSELIAIEALIVDLVPGTDTETITINVGGDVTSGEYGLVVNDMPANDAVIDVCIAGTLHGDEGPIVVSDGVDPDELTLTLWKVDIPESGNIIEEFFAGPGGENGSSADTKEMEQNILYIIKVKEPEGASITLDGTTKSHGWDTAKEGETVTMFIEVKEGYKLLCAYNGLGEKVPLKMDKNGNYYVEVPRGGGVYLTASMSEPFKAGQWWYGETAPVSLSFDFDGGKIGEDEGPATINTWIGNYIHLPEAPEKEGFAFAYWKELLPEEENTKEEPLQYKAGQSLQVRGDMRFIAVWEQSDNT